MVDYLKLFLLVGYVLPVTCHWSFVQQRVNPPSWSVFSLLSVINYLFLFDSSAGGKTTTDGGAGEPEMGTAAGRKRRWGSSTAVTAKKPSISITTDSLKVLTQHIRFGENVKNIFDVFIYFICGSIFWSELIFCAVGQYLTHHFHIKYQIKLCEMTRTQFLKKILFCRMEILS